MFLFSAILTDLLWADSVITTLLSLLWISNSSHPLTASLVVRCKESTCNAGDLGSIPGLGRSPGGGHGNPFQYSCLGNPYGQRSLMGCSSWDLKVFFEKTSKPSMRRVTLLPSSFWSTILLQLKESDTTEQLSMHARIFLQCLLQRRYLNPENNPAPFYNSEHLTGEATYPGSYLQRKLGKKEASIKNSGSLFRMQPVSPCLPF